MISNDIEIQKTSSNELNSNINKINSSSSNEEEFIHNLVNDIYQNEKKISEIQNNQNNNDINSKENEINQLKSKESELKSNLNQSKIDYENSLKKFQFEIEQKQNDLNKTNEQINELKNKLLNFNPISFKNKSISNLILSNSFNNNFLSNEQIQDLIENSKTKKNTNENEKKKFQLENMKNLKISYKNNLSNLTQKIEEYQNILKMAKEEKTTTKEEIINIISQKESLEEIIKMSIININFSEEDINNSDIRIFSYEFLNLEPKKASKEICEYIFELLTQINNKNIHDEENVNNLTSLGGSNGNINNNNNNFLNNNNKSYYANTNNNLTVNKEYLNNLINSEIENFVKMMKLNINGKNKIEIFIEKLANIIINSIYSNPNNNMNVNAIGLNEEFIMKFLIFYFKVYYYEIIIKNKINFINKEYKTNKKEINKLIDTLKNDINKTNNKIEDLETKIQNFENLEENNNNNNNKNEEIDLNQTELNYIDICRKGNNLLTLKTNIENEIKNLNENIEKLNNDFNTKNNDQNNEINNINNKITEIKKEIEMNKLKSNEEIITLRKQIADKYNIIKTQLQLYKSKHGSNLAIYNKLVDNINSTIKSTYYKPKINLDNSAFLPTNNFTRNINNEFMNYPITNYNSLAKEQNRNLVLNNNNNYYYNNNNNNNNFNDNFNNNNNNFNNVNSMATISTDNLINMRGNFDDNNNNYNNLNLTSNDILKNNNNNNIRLNYQAKSTNNLFNLNNNNNNNIYINNPYDNLNITSTNLNITANNVNDNNNNNFDNDFNAKNINMSIDKSNMFIPSTSRLKSNNNINNNNKIHNLSMNFSPLIPNINNININNNNNNINNNNKKLRKHANKNNYSSADIDYNFINNNNNYNNYYNINNNNNNNNHQRIGNSSISPINFHINNNNSDEENNNNNNNNNKNNKIWQEEREKLAISIQNLKNKISSKKEKYSFSQEISQKLFPLTQITFCFYRTIQGSYTKYNPLSNLTQHSLTGEPYNFIKSTISLFKNFNSIRIVPSTQFDPIDIPIEQIDNTVVNSMIKTIIEIHRSYRKYKQIFKSDSLEDFIEKEKEKNYVNVSNNKLSKNDIAKCALNRNFNFSLLVNKSKRFEIILCSYEDFKMWINGTAFIIKNKNEIVQMLNNNNNNNNKFYNEE